VSRRKLLPLAARAWPLGLLAAVSVVALGLGRACQARAATPVTIEIDQFQFSPHEITVDVGTKIEWINHDQTVHNIVSQQARLASPGMDTGDHFDYTFAQPGDYPYLCGLHPHMTGIVHVRAPGNSG